MPASTTSQASVSTTSKFSLTTRFLSSRRREALPSSCPRLHLIVRRERYCEGTDHRSTLPPSSSRQYRICQNYLLIRSHKHQCIILSWGSLLRRFVLLSSAQDHCFDRWQLHHPMQQYSGYIWISLQQYFRHNLSIEEHVAVRWWWCRLKSILVIDVVTDDDHLHRCGNHIQCFRNSVIFHYRARSSGGQRVSDKCYRWVVTRDSRVTMADRSTVTGIRWGNVLSILFVSLASPAPARSFYTSALTRNSLYFCPGASCAANGLYYYKPIGFMTATSGDYVIQSNSTLDTYGYIFNSTVRQITGVSGALMSDDESGGNSQFLMTISVQAMFNYTLIATTFAANVTGPFSVSATGDPPLTFFALWGCSGKTEIDESLSCFCTVCWFAE